MNTLIEEDEIETTDDAFLSAIEPNFLGETKLYPFSLMRQSIAIALGCKEDSADAFFDAVIIVWLCTQNEDQVLATKRDKTKAVKEAFAWGDNQGYSLVNFDPLFKIYSKITAEIRHSSNAVLADKDKVTEKNSGGPPTS